MGEEGGWKDGAGQMWAVLLLVRILYPTHDREEALQVESRVEILG